MQWCVPQGSPGIHVHMMSQQVEDLRDVRGVTEHDMMDGLPTFLQYNGRQGVLEEEIDNICTISCRHYT